MERSCRLCRETTNVLTSISVHVYHSTENEAKVSLGVLINIYLNINTSICEALICSNCLEIIEEWHLFREKCLEHEKHLQKHEIKFEEVITTAHDVHPVEYNPISVKKQNNPDQPLKVECNDTEENVEYFTEILEAHHTVSALDILESSSNEAADPVVKHSGSLKKKCSRRLKTRQSIPEATKVLGSRGKRSRPRMRDEECERKKRIKRTYKDEKQRIQPKICTICGMARTDMASHMRWHNNERPYQCPHCPKIFVNTSNLRNHINLHTREKLYKCDLCDKEFASSTGRSKHRETHSTEPAHLCAICGKSFRYRASLARHKLIHFGEPKAKCTVCNMVFLTKTRLTKHSLVHLEEKPFNCDICNRSFNRKDNLKTHMKTHLKIIMKIEAKDI